ncbi:SusC/RagA family TonB-linked outer membrane protein [Cytophagaceae bacterium DM2B3-1]|uniref:SusC/RagA family TonB-linked outer membrane protein n=1 Tax=Xanthocytophaga flava TaxID=3048013 RepID=A0ABT7CF90_9BACT|nr:SusC/RagA family TonB-linked outer membrane protein [Xanthocytophaga flavus]MDJ1491752.1 SusC/RagA family TonB-linked outer membrane protein [Xanthocytophaga flavus]
MKRKLLVFLMGLLWAYTYATAQDRTISGSISDQESKSALPGVNVIVKGTTIGTTTNSEGKFQLKVPQENATLIISFIGYVVQEIPIGNRTTIDIVLVPDVAALGEVVVTALGIEREKKALGYSVQEIKGDQLNQARETNLVNALSGKIAGIQVTGTNGTPGGSSRIVIRGSSSIGGNNQPLFVVDGVPIDNGNYSYGSKSSDSQFGTSSTSVDYGNGAGAINPDDIASVSVLKGPNAAALYGSRGTNGVILITTKSGKGVKGIGVTVNTNTTFEKPFRLPSFQNAYGQGAKGLFEYKDGKGGGVNDGVDESWGPQMDGRLLPQYNSPVDANGVRTPTPFLPQPDNVKNFFETGATYTNSVAVAGSNDKGDFRLSYTNLSQKGILPNTDYKRNTVSLNAGLNITPRLSAKVSANYIKDGSKNRNSWGLYFIWFGRQVDTDDLKDYVVDGTDPSDWPVQRNWNTNYWNNPYFVLNRVLRPNNKDRLFGNVSLNYKFTDWLNLTARSGTDFFTDRRYVQTPKSVGNTYGSYTEDVFFVKESNSDFLLSMNRNVAPALQLTASVGGNHRRRDYQRNYINIAELSLPNIFNVGNARSRPDVANNHQTKVVNSLYASAQLSFKDYLFIDASARNDWSSALPKGNRSYFYPSVSVSGVLTDMLNIQSSVLSFAKVRASVARTGNDTEILYQDQQTFKYESAWGSTPTVSENNVIANARLKPELTTAYEVGAEVNLFHRISLEFAYYEKQTKNQILNVNISQASGYQSRVTNAGLVTNKGIEIEASGAIIKTEGGFTWDLGLNFSRNRNKVVELGEGLQNYQLGTVRGMSVEARVGQSYGTFFGTAYARDPQGRIIYGTNGLPIVSSTRRILGNFTPDWTGGISNTFSFKGISISTLIDAKMGGNIYSQTVAIGRYTGVLAETNVGRETGIVGDGVVNTGTTDNPVYAVNTKNVSSEDWHHGYYNRNNNEPFVFDASYIKLREIKLSYTLPQKWFGKIPVRNVQLAVVGRNLALLYSKVPHIDPETSLYSSDSNVQGLENGQIPTTRSLGFNLSFGL